MYSVYVCVCVCEDEVAEASGRKKANIKQHPLHSYVHVCVCPVFVSGKGRGLFSGSVFAGFCLLWIIVCFFKRRWS